MSVCSSAFSLFGVGASSFHSPCSPASYLSVTLLFYVLITTSSSVFLSTCLFKIISVSLLYFSHMFATSALAPISSILISSILFIPINHLYILISVDPSKFCSAFLSAHVPLPYIRTRLMTVFYAATLSTFLYRFLCAYHNFSFLCIYFGSLPL